MMATAEKSTGKKVFTNKERTKAGKRNLSDVSNPNTSSDEFSILMSELEDIKRKTVTKTDMKSIVSSIVNDMLNDAKKVMEKQFDDFKKQQDEVRGDLIERIDRLHLENETLKETISAKSKQIREMEVNVKEALKIAKRAESKSNFNEQYSRKSNIKIFGVEEKERENTNEVVRSMMKDVAKIDVSESEIVACHRIPGGKNGLPRPIILKVKNSDVKAKIMRKRSEVKSKGHGIRLADDVTRANSILIQKLNDNHHIEQGYYYNGSVFGRMKSGQKMKFDIHDDIDKKMSKSARGRSGYETSDSEAE
ncbi:hypothetical protein FSP39_008330 [Pinctada imbricata]|uniref:Uncharacterized protein n=1 Tax=Pinctada imbricata TaxID=66713 RepID=A0AA88Y3T8_PINIB|nr:hypothetical protein FSP39_008330 [Pinctada imbricata]